MLTDDVVPHAYTVGETLFRLLLDVFAELHFLGPSWITFFSLRLFRSV